MKLRFSKTTTITCSILALLMCYASYWQWGRHLDKIAYIKELEFRLNLPPTKIEEILPELKLNPESFIHRRVIVSGKFDFSKEITIKNRRHENHPGKFVITPIRLESGDQILVNRGFLPIEISDLPERKNYQNPENFSFIGLIKESQPRKIFSPADPEVSLENFKDDWLRLNIPAISKQLPYPILPISLEIMSTDNLKQAEEQIVKSSSGKADILVLPMRGQAVAGPLSKFDSDRPIPVFDTIIPPGRHFGYVFEWLFMALLTALIGIILQLKRH